MTDKISMLDAMVLEMAAEGKSARQISEALSISVNEAHKRTYDLLDREIVTDVESRRKLNIYRFEKIIEALWARTMASANDKDVKNLIDLLDKTNTLMGLNKEQDAEAMARMHGYQLAAYMSALMGLIAAFKMVAPDIMSEDEWSNWSADQLEIAQREMQREIEM